MTLHVSMIVRNEADRFLSRSLRCARDIVDRSGGLLVITDDCSDDEDTYSLSLDFGSVVFRNERPLFWENEGVARQNNYEKISSLCRRGDWILSLDADETISDPVRLVDRVEADGDRFLVASLPLYEFWDETHYRVDGFWFGTKTSRLYAWQKGGRFAQKDFASGSEPLYVQDAWRTGKILKLDDVHLLHWGYSREEERVRKHRLYTSRSGGHGHNNAHVNSIVDPNPTLRRYV